MVKRKEPLVLAIGGGKGGVGKSMVTSNLAVHYCQAGFNVVLLDLDFGAANIHTIFGIRKPTKSLAEYFANSKSNLTDCLLDTPVPRLKIVAGSGFVPELANLKYAQKIRLIQDIKTLHTDLVLLDLAAGTSSNVIDFFTMTHAGIIVTTPEPTSIVNAYEFLKNAVYRILYRVFKDQDNIIQIIQQSLLPNNPLNITTLSDLIEAIAKIDQWGAKNVREICSNLNLYLVLNQARTVGDTQLGARLYDITRKHLNIHLNYSSMIFYNQEVSKSVFQMSPVSLSNPESITSYILKRIATVIIKNLMGRVIRGEEQASFEGQLAYVIKHAQSDFGKNLLTQYRMQKELLKVENPIFSL